MHKLTVSRKVENVEPKNDLDASSDSPLASATATPSETKNKVCGTRGFCVPYILVANLLSLLQYVGGIGRCDAAEHNVAVVSLMVHSKIQCFSTSS